MSLIFQVFTLLCVLVTILPITKLQWWWIRIFDFPRLQIVYISLLNLFISSIYSFQWHNFFPLLAVIFYQLMRIFPYTTFARTQVKVATEFLEEDCISVVVCNVLMTNRNSQDCVSMLKKADADIVLMIETDKWWENALQEIFVNYPYKKSAPHANTYGMILFSKLELVHVDLKYIFEYDMPSMHCIVKMRNGVHIKFYGIHPKPPAPNESLTTIKRDAELVIVGRDAKHCNKPSIVAGDLNDVAWSHTTHLFQKISGLLDPRIGRGMFSTFNAKSKIFRWPLDHVFHSPQFQLIEVRRLEYIQSDHFPIYIKLVINRTENDNEPVEEATKEDLAEAIEMIKLAKKE